MKRKLLNLALGTVATLSMSSLATQAQAITLDLSFTGQNTTATGTGSVTIDDALFTPNQRIFGSGSLAGFTAFQANFTNLTTVPNSTTFNLSDVTSFILFTDSNNSLTDFNFFTNPNADGFVARGVAPFTVRVARSNKSGSLGDLFTQMPNPFPNLLSCWLRVLLVVWELS